MKIIFPSKRVDAPMLSEEQIRKLMDGRYVEGAFGLDEGDSFTIRYGGERFEAFCYRMIDPGRCRIRRTGRGQGHTHILKHFRNVFYRRVPMFRSVTWQK